MTFGLDPNRAAYESFYGAGHLDLEGLRARSPYDRAFIAFRLEQIRRLCADVDVADLGCGTGAYLLPAARVARFVYGIDFSGKLLGTLAARLARESARDRVRLIQADVRALPLQRASVDAALSIATLYHVADADRAIAETGRILRPGGRALIELGEQWSLNTIVVQHAASGVRSHHMRQRDMSRALRLAGLRIDEHRRFQLLPMYGGPLWLRPLVSARWKALMGLTVAGRLVDEWVSSAPLFRRFAFRHVFVCTKR